MRLVQITPRSGIVKRVPLGKEPLVEIKLEDNQRIVAMELREAVGFFSDRKTADFYWTALVETCV